MPTLNTTAAADKALFSTKDSVDRKRKYHLADWTEEKQPDQHKRDANHVTELVWEDDQRRFTGKTMVTHNVTSEKENVINCDLPLPTLKRSSPYCVASPPKTVLLLSPPLVRKREDISATTTTTALVLRPPAAPQKKKKKKKKNLLRNVLLRPAYHEYDNSIVGDDYFYETPLSKTTTLMDLPPCTPLREIIHPNMKDHHANSSAATTCGVFTTTTTCCTPRVLMDTFEKLNTADATDLTSGDFIMIASLLDD